jgi:glycosyltransferase involved in cell wall biosynthesis
MTDNISMRIGIDCRTILNPKIGERAGVGHYTYYLVKNLLKLDKRNEYVLYFDWRVQDTREFEQKNVKIKHFPFSQYNKFLPFAYSHMLITAYLMKEGLDIFHSPITSLPLTYPKKSIVTVHDLAIYKNPAWFPGQIFSTKLLVPQSLRKADRIIAVSQSTKKDLKEIFNVPDKKIKVVYEGAVVNRIPVKSKNLDSLTKFKIGSKYVLFIGTLEPRKNLISLVRAFKIFLDASPTHSAYQLILAGAKGYKSEDIFSAIKSERLSKQVKCIGYVTQNQKIDLLKKAFCFAFPSSYEGFGLPVLEAMALGTPVITSNISSLPEISGQAALLINPEKEQEIANAFKKLANNDKLREAMKKKGVRQAEQFSWVRCATETMKVYESLVKK